MVFVGDEDDDVVTSLYKKDEDVEEFEKIKLSETVRFTKSYKYF